MPIWVSDLLVTIVLVGMSELAFLIARKRQRSDVLPQLGTTQASMLGLLALVLGFTLAMAESRFDARRKVVIEESLAVGTTYLRTDFLPEPQRTHSRALVREYVDARIAFYEGRPSVAEATKRSQALHTQLWADLAAIAATHDSPLVATYVTSLNEMLDLEAARDLVLHARVPWSIHLLLLVIAVVAMAINGYTIGLSRVRVPVALTVVPVLVAFAYGILLDLDRSRVGLITTGDRPMERLQQSLPSSPGTSSARASGRSF